MRKEVMIWTGAGQIGMAIARRMGFGKKIVVGDKSLENAKTITKIMNDAGFDTEPVEMDLTDQEEIFTKICLQNARQADRERLMKWQTWQNF